MSVTTDSLIISRKHHGRPSRAGVRATKRVEFVATEHERQELGRVAAAEGKPVATLIREAVNEYVADYGGRRVFSSPDKRTESY